MPSLSPLCSPDFSRSFNSSSCKSFPRPQSLFLPDFFPQRKLTLSSPCLGGAGSTTSPPPFPSPSWTPVGHRGRLDCSLVRPLFYSHRRQLSSPPVVIFLSPAHVFFSIPSLAGKHVRACSYSSRDFPKCAQSQFLTLVLLYRVLPPNSRSDSPTPRFPWSAWWCVFFARNPPHFPLG